MLMCDKDFSRCDIFPKLSAMPLSDTALGAILIARSAYIGVNDYSIPDFQAVIETHTDEGTPERTAWMAHLTAVINAVEDGKDVPEVHEFIPRLHTSM
jgi:hypothetical protein